MNGGTPMTQHPKPIHTRSNCFAQLQALIAQLGSGVTIKAALAIQAQAKPGASTNDFHI